ncbi:MAG: aminoacyl-tRNA deacylase [Ignavibacteriae bacterium]|nr:aminoacyl-tRNA deacylase [Ignavibacteriota bacterium]
MLKDKYPVTQAIRELKSKNISFIPYLFTYEEKGGTAHTASELNVPEHSVIKTLVMENDSGKGLIVLMHGDMEVSTKELARFLNVKSVATCSAEKAFRLTRYEFGGTSPFGTKEKLPVYVESSIFNLEKIYINGGKRGFIIQITPNDLRIVLNPVEVKVGIPK